ncbi:MAG: hypothetical protein ACI4WM_07065 [Erysipelotrichaceae bacterium]
MQLNDLQRQSIIDAAKKEYGKEHPDEIIESISGGRGLTDDEHKSIIKAFLSADVDFNYFNKAIDKYTEYIKSLPEECEEILFKYADWK